MSNFANILFIYKNMIIQAVSLIQSDFHDEKGANKFIAVTFNKISLDTPYQISFEQCNIVYLYSHFISYTHISSRIYTVGLVI
jgi:hypothetical protein